MFGVDFDNNKLVNRNTDKTSIVYNITIYNTPTTSIQKYVQVKGGKLVDATQTEVPMPINRFAKSETADLHGIANVYFADENKTCEKVVITDREEFYCPEDIYAETVDYVRKFTAGMNSVCLPFELTKDLHADITGLCTFDKETTDKFWFKLKESAIPANTPVLLLVEEGKSIDKLDLNNITIKKTESQIVMDEGDEDDPSKCYGLFKLAGREEFKGGASEAYKVYGLTTNGKFSPAGPDTKFPAFRLALYSDSAQPSTIAPRSIGIVDEKGVEITDDLLSGVESVSANASALDITTGVGEINITTEADYGMVEVYSIDGQVAAMADVKAGTTTVNVQTGIYIVMGKKVMVK